MAQLGCCLVFLHFLCDILPCHPVLVRKTLTGPAGFLHLEHLDHPVPRAVVHLAPTGRHGRLAAAAADIVVFLKDRNAVELVAYPLDTIPYTGFPIWSHTWVGLEWISVLHHLAHLASLFCQIPICPCRIGPLNWADSGTLKIQVYPTRVRDQMGHPVLCRCFAVQG